MEIRQLTHFVAVAEERHFTRAAQRLHIVQSGLSASIRGLERELGTRLFTRSTRQVTLTDAGRVLLTEARRVLAAAETARDAVAAVRGLLRGRLRIGIMQSMRGLPLAAALADLHAAHPGVELELRQAGSADLAAQVRDAALDLAFLALPRAPDGVVLTRLLDIPMALACPAGHRLAQRATPVALAELATEDFVDLPAGWGSRMLTDAAFSAIGPARRIPFEVGEVGFLLDLVAQGLGVAVVPDHLSPREGVRLVPLAGSVPIFTISAALPDRAGGTPPARVLLELVTARLAAGGPAGPRT